MDVLPSRVNIKLDIETLGAGKRFEMPLKLLMAGDFSAGGESESVEQRERIAVNKTNLDSVLQRISPRLKMRVKNCLSEELDELDICLGFEELLDFSPETIIYAIPEIRRLIAMRNLLKDLKSNVLDDKKLKKSLNDVFEDPESRERLKEDLIAIIEDGDEYEDDDDE